jgi:hypothetical protein
MHTPRKHGGCPLGPIDQERRELRWIFSNNCGSRDTRISNRRPIPYALDTDWPVGAAGFEPLHIRIGICQDSQPGGRDSNLRISN